VVIEGAKHVLGIQDFIAKVFIIDNHDNGQKVQSAQNISVLASG